MGKRLRHFTKEQIANMKSQSVREMKLKPCYTTNRMGKINSPYQVLKSIQACILLVGI